MTDLKTLRERVAAATGPDRVLDAEIAIEIGGFSRYRNWWDGPGRTNPAWHALVDDDWVPLPAYTASLEVVLDLIMAKLPGPDWGRTFWQIDSTNYCELTSQIERTCDPMIGEMEPVYWDEVRVNACGPTPAVAMLTALLAALDADGDA